MTKADKIKFLTELKKEINKSTEFICDYPLNKEIVNFIWVETKDGLIGNTPCHYEVIFNSSKDGNPNIASVEVHFEDSGTVKNFQGIPLSKELEYADWQKKDGRIVYKNRDKGNNSKECIIEMLRKLERLIGKDLRESIRKQIPIGEHEIYREILEFRRDPALAKNAIKNAKYKCEIDPKHTSFIAKNGKNYMEGHHLIPISKQGNFSKSLNQAKNIVCLCPNCHKEIHLGNNRLELVKTLWNQRKVGLEAAGINITLNDLQSYY